MSLCLSLPITLAWDRRVGEQSRTALLHITNLKERRSYFALLPLVPSDTQRGDWEALTAAIGAEQPHPLAPEPQFTYGEEAVRSSLLFAQLP